MANITVNGKVSAPSGASAGGGSIKIKLLGVGSKSGATVDVVGGEFTTPIAADGTVDFTIESNTDGLVNTKYRASFHMPDGSRFARDWTIPATPTTQNIGNLS